MEENTHQEQVRENQEAPEIVEVEGQEISLSEVDNPKSYKFFQSKFTKEQEERRQLEQRARDLELQLARMEGRTEQVNAPQELRAPEEPREPDNYYELVLQATADPHGREAQILKKYRAEEKQYQKDLIRYNTEALKKSYEPIEQFYKKAQETEAQRQQRQQIVGQFTKVTNDVNLANEMAEWALSEDFINPQNIKEFYEWKKGKKANPIVDQKTKAYEQRQTRVESALPPGASEATPQNQDEFMSDLANFIKNTRM